MSKSPQSKARRRRGTKGRDTNHEKDDNMPMKGRTFKPHTTLLIDLNEKGQTWYDYGQDLSGRDETIFTDPPQDSSVKNSSVVQSYRIMADEIYSTELHLFHQMSRGMKSSSDEKWVENTMKRGTLKDRIAATSVVVTSDVIHKLPVLDSLLQMAGCGESDQANSRVSQMAAEAIEDIFLTRLLPLNRKLLTLGQRPLYKYEEDPKKTLSPKTLLLWRFEEKIKDLFSTFLKRYLSFTLKEGMELNKISALRTAGRLLRTTPEGESFVLSMMVNKLGDPGKKVVSSAAHELRRVLEYHGSMQRVIAREVQQLAHRPQLSPRALYNCVVFLNQLKLSNEDPESESTQENESLPTSLVNTYFQLFEVTTKATSREEEGMKGRLLSALLTGVNRARPYLAAKDQKMEAHMDALYKVVHTSPPSAATQALMLLLHVVMGDDAVDDKKDAKSNKDRFFRALYSKVSILTVLSNGKHLTLFFNLLYKAMKNDRNIRRVVTLAKRLLSTSLHSSPPVIAGSMFLINEVMKTHPVLGHCLDVSFEDEGFSATLDPTKRDPCRALVDGDATSGDEEIHVEQAPLWEDCLACHHFHPSVSKFSASLGVIEYTGDPLRDFGWGPFLDKFAFRNPKSQKEDESKSKSGRTVAQRKSSVRVDPAFPMNDPRFMRSTDIKPEDEFYLKFFAERARRDEMKGVQRNKKRDEDVSDEDEAFDLVEESRVEKVFDQEWDTDSEEEEYVNQLATELMEKSDKGRVDYDDEDPDMSGWEDFDGKDSKNDTSKLEDSNDSSEENDSSSSFQQTDEDSENEDKETAVSISSDEGDDLAFTIDSDSAEEDEDIAPAQNVQGRASKESKDKNTESLFADASEYEEFINKSWDERKRANANPTNSGGLGAKKRRKKR